MINNRRNSKKERKKEKMPEPDGNLVKTGKTKQEHQLRVGTKQLIAIKMNTGNHCSVLQQVFSSVKGGTTIFAASRTPFFRPRLHDFVVVCVAQDELQHAARVQLWAD
jgi:hypothetical protein